MAARDYSKNDGDGWLSHWVVLTPTQSCGPGALGVRDIPEGGMPNCRNLPADLYRQSRLRAVALRCGVSVTVPLPEGTATEGVSHDGVTSALRVNANVHAPLLCVTGVFDVASGDLSLSGRVK